MHRQMQCSDLGVVRDRIVERTLPTVEGREFYIPHKGVVLENAASAKLKVVYDASTQA